jgi:uncharacterized LabA/DUF88 family protein
MNSQDFESPGRIGSGAVVKRIGVFIDGANIYAATRALGFDIDYQRLLDFFRARGRLVRMFYYTAVLDDGDHSALRPLIDWLQYNGYTVVTKPAKEFTDALGRRRIRNDMDVELAIDMMEAAAHLDQAVLLSGAGDFRRLVEAVQRRGVRVTVISTDRQPSPMIADELRRQADVYLDLQDLAPVIRRRPAKCSETGLAGPPRPADLGEAETRGRLA